MKKPKVPKVPFILVVDSTKLYYHLVVDECPDGVIVIPCGLNSEDEEYNTGKVSFYNQNRNIKSMLPLYTSEKINNLLQSTMK